MPPHPVYALIALLRGRPLYHSLVHYPAPWAELLRRVRSAPPLPSTRLAALEAAVAALPDAALDGLEESLLHPQRLAPLLRLNPYQLELLVAVRLLGPAPCAVLADFLGRGRSNTFRSLQGLVSQNRLTRLERGRSVLYCLPDSVTQDGSHAR